MNLKQAMIKQSKEKDMTNELNHRGFINRKLMAEKDEKKILKGAAAIEAERVNKGGTDFSLYNLVMSVVTFKDCETSLDCNRRLYEGLYPYIKRLNNENILMRQLLKDHDDPRLKEIFEIEPDINKFATETIKKITEAARQRARANKYMDLKPKEIVS